MTLRQARLTRCATGRAKRCIKGVLKAMYQRNVSGGDGKATEVEVKEGDLAHLRQLAAWPPKRAGSPEESMAVWLRRVKIARGERNQRSDPPSRSRSALPSPHDDKPM